jgi:hypothetical protein
MRVHTISQETNIQNNVNNDTINIFCQFFIHPNVERQLEITTCLKKNVKNKFISKIYLLNERIYTDEELDVSSNKIIQIDVEKRLQFKDVFEYIFVNDIKGYNIIINSDIFFKKNIQNLFKSDIHINKKMYALLRYEYNVLNPDKTYLFGPRGDSQDTWIIHSNFNIGIKECKPFNFEFGKPGCDNKMTYLMSVLGYEIINDPTFIKSYHIHETNIRNYTNNDRMPPPYERVLPKKYYEILKIDDPTLEIYYNPKYNHKISNNILFEYISKKIQNNQNFIIPRVSGIETQFAIYSTLTLMPQHKDNYSTIYNFFESNTAKMKKHAGIKLSSNESINKYSKLYLESFNDCEIYASWAPFDAVYTSIKYAHEILNNLFKEKETIYAEAFDIYHYIYGTPWTFALKNKRILIVSNFEESIKEKIDIRKDIYGVDLFPNCEIITIKPPQTQGTEESQEFDVELQNFSDKLDEIKDKYDIALVSCGGYGNLVCSHIYKSGKSAIYIGGVLQMYWGILGSRWFTDRPDIIRLFLNKTWSRPKDSEKPGGHNGIENSCYW